MIWAHLFCCKNDLHTLFCRKNYLSTFFVTKKIYAHFFVAKTIYAFFSVAKTIYAFFSCRENDLCTWSGKFLRVESCHPENSDFLGLCWNQTDEFWIFHSCVIGISSWKRRSAHLLMNSSLPSVSRGWLRAPLKTVIWGLLMIVATSSA